MGMQKGFSLEKIWFKSMKPRLPVQCLGWIVCLLQDLVVGERSLCLESAWD
jgi:hypothetical protein